jgi:hypothetical protein
MLPEDAGASGVENTISEPSHQVVLVPLAHVIRNISLYNLVFDLFLQAAFTNIDIGH